MALRAPSTTRSSASSGNTYGARVAATPVIRAGGSPRLTSWRSTRVPWARRRSRTPAVAGSVEASSTMTSSIGSRASTEATASATSSPSLKHGTMTAIRAEPISAVSGMAQHLEDGQDDDPQVEAQRPVLDVVVVPLDPVGDRGLAAQAVDLGPAGDPGFDPVAVLVAGYLAHEALDELGPLRPRPDQAHVAAEHVQQLGELVQGGVAQEAPDRGAPVLAFDAAGRRARGGHERAPRRGGAHGAELEDVEHVAVTAHPPLAEQDGTGRGQSHGQ